MTSLSFSKAQATCLGFGNVSLCALLFMKVSTGRLPSIGRTESTHGKAAWPAAAGDHDMR